MLDRITLVPSDPSDLGQSAQSLLAQQKQSWEMLARGYGTLDSVQTRSIQLDDMTIKLQFNPGRMTSSAAKVDAKSIAERQCFLCPGNLPAEQRGLLFQQDYVVLCNPFPIFPEHFTIPHKKHVPQQIGTSFGAMLDLARALRSRYTVFYNGPKCGASAPDHLHFQAGNKAFMIVENEYSALKSAHGRPVGALSGVEAVAVAHPLRPFIGLESSDRDGLIRAFSAYERAFREVNHSSDEPLMNILAGYSREAWRIIIFPRAKHRPAFFFAEGDAKKLLSPASVDIGGVCITPVERDFHRITGDHLREMFSECCLSPGQFSELAASLKSTFQ